MATLIPERRMNKNGVMTTRWVLPASPSSASSSAIPAPSIGAPTKASPFDVMTSETQTQFSRNSIRFEKCTMADFDPGAVQAVDWMIQNALSEQGMAWYADGAVQQALSDVRKNLGSLRAARINKPFAPFNNLAVFGEAVVHRDGRNYDLDRLSRGLRGFDGAQDFLLEVNDEQRTQAVALVTVAARLEVPFVMDVWSGGNLPGIGLTSAALEGFVKSRPDDAEEIARIINERKNDDVEMIREILDHPQQALRDGLL